MKRSRSFLAIGPKPAYTGCSYSKQPRQLQCRQSGNANGEIDGIGWTKGPGLARKTPFILSRTPSNRRSRPEHNLVIYLNLGRRRYGT
ncbi:hypothetical protein [Laspinema olomoucense]|uniref:Uncharacterized protein n=1 Tax=Laspinema olomoucense D3b TaxID=2953688 RepID=A0ABT2N7F3_9CYAN|nr:MULTISPECIES: hypothetical protein [unclassified Laspinema]MCT7975057.1 hypothetical protein [Laspinema sp. D3d]MCT7978612.1 hypothetical protein [Laspinema sp. D3b]MCT7987155.1 hypothetical protein [Laspinema sp. D3a]MCT7992272.1 hypothetical protein [Laspinema sp. D3c]